MKKLFNLLLLSTAMITAAFTLQAATSFDFNGVANAELLDNLSVTGTPQYGDTIYVRSGLTANSTVSFTANVLNVGSSGENNSGSLYINSGTINLHAVSQAAFQVGSANTGTVYMTNANVVFGNGSLTVGAGTAGSNGTFVMSGGSITHTNPSSTISRAYISIATTSAANNASGKMVIRDGASVTAGFLVGTSAAGATGSAELVIHHDTYVKSITGARGFDIRANAVLTFVAGRGQSPLFNAVDLTPTTTTNAFTVAAGALLQLDVSSFNWTGDVDDFTSLELIKYNATSQTATAVNNLIFGLTGASDITGSGTDFSFTGANGYEYDVSFIKGASLLSAKVTITAVAIPEPSTYAAIIGLGVLAFVIYRRRKH